MNQRKNSREKVLIIKIGCSETLHPEFDGTASLGDVLRTTVILHLFKDSHVTWLVGKSAIPLLENNPMIDRILPFELVSSLQLQAEKFDTVVNLERIPGICALTSMVNARKKYGFKFNREDGIATSHPNSYEALKPYMQVKTKRDQQTYWQSVLYQILGHEWHKEEYILDFQPESKVVHDIGLNYLVGRHWPLKAWPDQNFAALAIKLQNRHFSVSFQQGTNDLQEYMNWIHSCKLLVTNDSLGMHLAIAMKKKVVVLFGPTSSNEVYLYKLGKKLLPKTQPDCLPCWSLECKQTRPCLEEITPFEVLRSVLEVWDAERS